MSKSHRDNAKARRKVGKVAYEKKRNRRKPIPKCKICGERARPHKLYRGTCARCVKTLVERGMMVDNRDSEREIDVSKKARNHGGEAIVYVRHFMSSEAILGIHRQIKRDSGK